MMGFMFDTLAGLRPVIGFRSVLSPSLWLYDTRLY